MEDNTNFETLVADISIDIVNEFIELGLIKKSIDVEHNSTVIVQAMVRANAKTGVEMEALTAVSMALLTIWDMTKQYEKDQEGQYPTTAINNIRVLTKVKQIE